MRRIGICQKCGKETIVQDHHIYGYGDKSDVVAPYCRSCDRKAHNKARIEGRCVLKSKDSIRLSTNSCHRRERKNGIILMHTEDLITQTLLPNIALYVGFVYNYKSKHMSFYSQFRGYHGYKIKTIDEMDVFS